MMTTIVEKPSSMKRWAIMVCACLVMMIDYYCIDIPSALNVPLDAYFGYPPDYAVLFSLLYTLYSIPNIVLPFFAGYFIDKFGVRVCSVIFASLIFLGSVIFAVGIQARSWPIMFVGRVVYGLGGETLFVSMTVLVAEWFRGKELALAFGIKLSLSRCGSVFNNLVSPLLAISSGVQFACWFGAILTAIGLCLTLLVCYIDKSHVASKKPSNLLNLGEGQGEEEDSSLSHSAASSIQKPLLSDAMYSNDVQQQQQQQQASIEKGQAPQFRDVLTFPLLYWLIVASCVIVYGCILPFNQVASALLLERDYFMTPPSGCHLPNPNACENDQTNAPVGCPSSTYYQPPLPTNVSVGGELFGDLSASQIDCSSDAWSAQSTGCAYAYCSRLDGALVEAAAIMSIPFIISACLSPFLGFVVDKYGKRAILASISPLVFALDHFLLGLTTISPVGPLVGQGIAYSIFAAALWPSVPLVVAERHTGLGYGVVTAVQNAGLSAWPLIVAAVYKESGNLYIPYVEIFFGLIASAGVFIGMCMVFVDFRYEKGVLNEPSSSSSQDAASPSASTTTVGEDVKTRDISSISA